MSDFTKLMDSDWKERAHNQGQEDASAGKKRDEPYVIAVTDSAQEANRLYHEGYGNTTNQKK